MKCCAGSLAPRGLTAPPVSSVDGTMIVGENRDGSSTVSPAVSGRIAGDTAGWILSRSSLRAWCPGGRRFAARAVFQGCAGAVVGHRPGQGGRRRCATRTTAEEAAGAGPCRRCPTTSPSGSRPHRESRGHRPLHVETAAYDERLELQLKGELDIGTVAGLRQALELASDAGMARIVVDMSELEFVDSSGLQELIVTHKRQQARGGEVVLRTPTPVSAVARNRRIRQVFTIS